MVVVVVGEGVSSWDRPKYSWTHQQQPSQSELNHLELHNIPESGLNAKKTGDWNTS